MLRCVNILMILMCKKFQIGYGFQRLVLVMVLAGGNFYYIEPDGSSTINLVSPSWTATPTNIARTEIAPSATNTDTHYILLSSSNPGETAPFTARGANLYKTTDNFATITALPEPNDADTSISSTDFTRNQSFYDLEIEVDPNNDDIVYAGGINWHRSSDGGQNWDQIVNGQTIQI